MKCGTHANRTSCSVSPPSSPSRSTVNMLLLLCDAAEMFNSTTTTTTANITTAIATSTTITQSPGPIPNAEVMNVIDSLLSLHGANTSANEQASPITSLNFIGKNTIPTSPNVSIVDNTKNIVTNIKNEQFQPFIVQSDNIDNSINDTESTTYKSEKELFLKTLNLIPTSIVNTDAATTTATTTLLTNKRRLKKSQRNIYIPSSSKVPTTVSSTYHRSYLLPQNEIEEPTAAVTPYLDTSTTFRARSYTSSSSASIESNCSSSVNGKNYKERAPKRRIIKNRKKYKYFNNNNKRNKRENKKTKNKICKKSSFIEPNQIILNNSTATTTTTATINTTTTTTTTTTTQSTYSFNDYFEDILNAETVDSLQRQVILNLDFFSQSRNTDLDSGIESNCDDQLLTI